MGSHQPAPETHLQAHFQTCRTALFRSARSATLLSWRLRLARDLPLNIKVLMFDHRKCERCKAEYRPSRQDQSYCSPRCKRASAHGRERFTAGRKGARKRRLQAPDMVPGMEIAGSVRNGPFSPIETIPCKPTKSLVSGPIDILGGSRAGWPNNIDPNVIERIRWCEIGGRTEKGPDAKSHQGDRGAEPLPARERVSC